MNKKIFKSLFMGALLVGSVGTLTSCSKDYDNDINSLKDQIAKLATTEALNAKVTELQTSIASVKTAATAAQTTATTALNNAATNATALATLKSSVSDLSAIVATKADKAALESAISNMNALLATKADQSALTSLDAKVAALTSEVSTLKSDLNAKIDAVKSTGEANAAAIAKNTEAIEATNAAITNKINALVADIAAKYATKEALAEATANLTTQIGTLPTKEYVAGQIAEAIKNKADKDAVTAEIAEAIKDKANKADVTAEIAEAVGSTKAYVDKLISDLSEKATGDIAAAKQQILDAMDKNTADLKIYIAAAIADQAAIDAANLKSEADKAASNLASAVETINGLIKGNSDAIAANSAAITAAQEAIKANSAAIKANSDLINTNKEEAALALAAVKLELEGQINNVKSTLETQFNNQLNTAVENLTALINANKGDIAANKAAIEAAQALLQGQIDAAVGRIGNLETAIDGLRGRVEVLEANINNKVEIADFNTAINGLTGSYTGLKNQIDALMTKINSMVTNVAVIEGTDPTTGVYYDANIDFYSFIENATKFGPTNSEVEFKAGTVNATEDALLLRVNPTTAELDASQIHLLNSQNEDLTKYLNVSIEPYQGLLSRAATSSKSGLWVAKFSLKSDADVEAFAKAVVYTKDNINYNVDFCVAINNALVGTDRAVVSPYEVTVETAKAEKARNILANVGGKKIDDIYNRYNVGNFKEKVWITSTTANPTPDIRENISDKNTTNSDDRSGKTEYANAYIGQPLTIDFYKMVSGKPESTTVRAFYVTLDNDCASTEAPSEAYRWGSYKIDNLGKVFENTKSGSITIQSLGAKGDVIGFRIYAVNYDGTLQDPDGRAFYVKVAAPTATAMYDTKIIPTSADEVSYSKEVAVTEDLSALAQVASWSTESAQVPPAKTLYGIEFLGADGNILATTNGLTSDFINGLELHAKEIKFVRTFIKAGYQSKFEDSSNDDLKDYPQSFYFKDAYGATIYTIKTNMNKVMPTAPTGFSIKTSQLVGDKLYCYLPDVMTETVTNGISTINFATTGHFGLKDAFNGLYDAVANAWDERYSITFEGAGKNLNGKATDLTITKDFTKVVNGKTEEYYLTVGADRILNGEKEYNTVIKYNYGKISSADPTKDYEVKVTSFPTTFRSILQDKDKYTWNWLKNEVPELKYGVENQTISGSKLNVVAVPGKDMYNESGYAKAIGELVADKKLKIVEAHLYSKEGDDSTKDEYFTVTYNTATKAFDFSGNPSTTQGPKATVNSTLKIIAKDAFGKDIEFGMPVKVLKS